MTQVHVLLVALLVLAAIAAVEWLTTPLQNIPYSKDNQKWQNDQIINWEHLLDSHLAARRPEQVVVCNWDSDNGSGLCNRMLHASSCLLLAMLTNRTLLLHWPANAFHWDYWNNEYTGIEPFGAIFEPTPFFVDSQKASGRECLMLDTEDPAVIAQLQQGILLHSDAACLQFQPAFRFWGGMLPYGTPSTSFSAIAHRVFVPLPSNLSWTNSTAQDCDWLIQYRARAHHTKVLPPLKAFLECGRVHGMHQEQGVWLLSDAAAEQHMQVAPLEYCRSRLGCDRDTVHLMRYFASCKRALLSDYSTFGHCVAGMGDIPQQWVVHSTVDEIASCTRKFDRGPSWRLTDFSPNLRFSPQMQHL